MSTSSTTGWTPPPHPFDDSELMHLFEFARVGMQDEDDFVDTLKAMDLSDDAGIALREKLQDYMDGRAAMERNECPDCHHSLSHHVKGEGCDLLEDGSSAPEEGEADYSPDQIYCGCLWLEESPLAKKLSGV